MGIDYAERIETIELVENIRPFAHTANMVMLPDGRIFLIWVAGQFEGSEDMIVAGALRHTNGEWEKPHAVIRRFQLDGETWIPAWSTVLQSDDGDLHIFFCGYPLSEYAFVPKPAATVRSAWMVPDYKPIKAFHTQLRDFKAEDPRMIIPDELGVNIQGRPLHLQSGEWAIPYDSLATNHGHFIILDKDLENWEKQGDIFAPPGVCEPAVVQLPDGEVLCYLRYWAWGTGGHIWKSVSRDNCRTFTVPVETNLRNPCAGNDIALSRSGRLLIAYNDSYTLRVPLCVGISDDMGKTFTVRDIETGLGEPCYGWRLANYEHNSYSYPKLIQTADGVWHLFYTYRYECIKHAWFSEEWLEGGRRVIGLK